MIYAFVCNSFYNIPNNLFLNIFLINKKSLKLLKMNFAIKHK